MFRLATAAIGLFGFGVIAAEMFNNFDVIETRINVLAFAVPLTLAFLASELLLARLKKKAGQSDADNSRYQAIVKHYRLVVGALGVSMVILIPVVWWGVIKELAALAGDGYRDF